MVLILERSWEYGKIILYATLSGDRWLERRGAMIDRVFAALEESPQGVDIATLAERTGCAECALIPVLDQLIDEGRLERWPFWPERFRAVGSATTPFLAEVAELRALAWPEQADVSTASNWPTTLHLMLPDSHAVLERYPWTGEQLELSRERAVYASPRRMRSGATAMAMIAFFPAEAQEAIRHHAQVAEPDDLFTRVGEQRYCLLPGRDVVGGWILSAPLLGSDGTPFGALCTFGSSELLPERVESQAAPAIVRSATRISAAFSSMEVARRSKAIVDAWARRGAEG